jgi:hypothetical protein
MGKVPQRELESLRDMISQAHTIVSSSRLPEGRSERAAELLSDALATADYLLSVSPAEAMGSKGGATTAKRGPEYFRKISKMRKKCAGGRPKTSD